MEVRFGDRWWLWMQEHPWTRRLGILALIGALAGVIVAGDVVIRWTCDHGRNFGC